jgi:hypothetical protein
MSKIDDYRDFVTKIVLIWLISCVIVACVFAFIDHVIAVLYIVIVPILGATLICYIADWYQINYVGYYTSDITGIFEHEPKRRKRNETQ